MGYREIEKKMNSWKINIMNSKQEMEEMFIRLESIENRCKRTNILIDGIAEENGENWSNQMRKLDKGYQSNLGLDGINMCPKNWVIPGRGKPREMIIKGFRL